MDADSYVRAGLLRAFLHDDRNLRLRFLPDFLQENSMSDLIVIYRITLPDK